MASQKSVFNMFFLFSCLRVPVPVILSRGLVCFCQLIITPMYPMYKVYPPNVFNVSTPSQILFKEYVPGRRQLSKQ